METNAIHCSHYLIHFFSLLLSDVSHVSPSPSFALSVLACLSLYISRSLCSSPLAIADLTTPISPRRETETARLATDHDPLCDEEELQCEGHGGRK